MNYNQSQTSQRSSRLARLSCSPCLGLSSKALFALTPLLLLPYSFSTQALSATTAKTIEGTKPYILLSDGVTKLTNLNELLGFSMPKQDGSAGREQIDASMAGTVLTAPTGMTYNDVIALVTANGVAQPISGATVGDDDGDADVPANTSITGTMKATWYEGTTVVPAANLGNTLTPCGGPYKLKLEIPTAVSANTTYGAPNTNPYGTSTGVTYTFTPSPRICYLQPQSMQIYTGTAGSTIKYANGYNPDTWVEGKGFKRQAGFPTTGFQNAVFNVIGSGTDQSKYRCSTTSTSISLSGTAGTALGANCQVTITAATKAAFGTPTITMEYNTSTTGTPNWVVTDTYTLSTPVRWALGKGRLMYGDKGSLSTSTSFPTLDACRGVAEGTTTWQQAAGQNEADKALRAQFLYRRDELSNSPKADRGNVPEGSSWVFEWNYGSRDVDGTFTGEWGYVQNYTGSVWSTGYSYWTAEGHGPNSQYGVDPSGLVQPIGPFGERFAAICRGE